MDELKRAFDAANLAAELRSYIPGLLGRPEIGSTFTIPVANRPGFLYVRTSTNGTESVTVAQNAAGVPQRASLPVRMRLEGGVLVIHGVDYLGGRWEAATSSDVTNLYGVTKHTHRISSGLEYEIEALRIEPGRVQWSSGMTVQINAFRYYFNSAWDTWLGGTIDLTSYQPVTSGKWRWVLVGINPATNTAVAASGADYDTTTSLTIDLIDAISFGSYIPCVAIKIKESDTALDDITRYADAHDWFTSGVFDTEAAQDAIGSILTDTATVDFTYNDGTPSITADVIDDSITNAKLRNSGALSVVGRTANSTGDPADISASATSAAVLRESGSTIGFGTVATAGIANNAITNAKLAQMAQDTIKGRADAAGTGDPTDLTATQVLAIIETVDGSGSGLDADLLDGHDSTYFVAASADAEAAQDAVGGILTDTATIDFTYDDAGNTISAIVIDDSIDNAKLRNSGALSVVGRSANSSGDPADISASAASGAVLRESGSVLGFGTIATAGIANNAVDDTKIRDGGALSVIGRSANSSGDPADISASAASDAVLRESGSTLGFGTIATAGIANNAVTDAKLRQGGALSIVGRSANSTGNLADISASAASGAVLRESGSTVGFGTIVAAGIASDAVTTAKILDANVTNAKLANMTAATYKGRHTASTGVPEDVSAANVAADIQASIDHGSIAGLSDDDHTQYAILAGRSGGQTLYGGTAANDDITIRGTSSATKTTSYVLLSDDGGAVLVGMTSPPTSSFGGPTCGVERDSNGAFMIYRNSNDAGGGTMVGTKARSGFPGTALSSGDVCFTFAGEGSDGTSSTARNAGQLRFVADANWSNGSSPGSIRFFTTPSGSTTVSEAARFDSSQQLGIQNTSPQAALHVGAGADTPGSSNTTIYASKAGATAIVARDSTNNVEAKLYANTGDVEVGAHTNHAVLFLVNNAEKARIDTSGQLGVGITPQTLLHAYDGTAGFGFFEATAVAGSAHTFIVDGTGDITKRIAVFGWARTVTGGATNNLSFSAAVNSNTDLSDGGSNTLRFRVSSAGVFDCIRNAGTDTWDTAFFAVWI